MVECQFLLNRHYPIYGGVLVFSVKVTYTNTQYNSIFKIKFFDIAGKIIINVNRSIPPEFFSFRQAVINLIDMIVVVKIVRCIIMTFYPLFNERDICFVYCAYMFFPFSFIAKTPECSLFYIRCN